MSLDLLIGTNPFMKSPVTYNFPLLSDCSIAIIGLGYVGLPLAVEIAKHKHSLFSGETLNRKVIGFDISISRIDELQAGFDRTLEVEAHELNQYENLTFTSDASRLAECDAFIVTVPTPIDSSKQPDLLPLKKASETVARALKARALRSEGSPSTKPIVIYESTVYPGATEEYCVPVLAKVSGLEFNSDFFCGYSPERINPGDKNHTLSSIVKVTSGSSPESSAWVDQFYKSMIAAGTHLASSLKVAEAAKVIENTQRDLNIALVNELSIIFNLIGIDTLEVLEASGTKWNFLPFRPGLVGGHCIGVDPYYLTHKSEQLGYHPQLVLAGRRINDGMSAWVSHQIVQELCRRGLRLLDEPVLILGISFKEDCPDLRNTKIVDIVATLEKYGLRSIIVDPWIDPSQAQQSYGLEVLSDIPPMRFKIVVAAVQHSQFKKMSVSNWSDFLDDDALIYDLKGIVPRELNAVRL